LYVFLTRYTVNFLINFPFSTATDFSRAPCGLFMLKVPLIHQTLGVKWKQTNKQTKNK